MSTFKGFALNWEFTHDILNQSEDLGIHLPNSHKNLLEKINQYLLITVESRLIPSVICSGVGKQKERRI